nr:hypothetical protein CFP56_56953 [Quercus suber]
MLILLEAASEIRHAAALLQQLGIAGQGLEDVGLAQRERDPALLVVDRHDEILDLATADASSATRSPARVWPPNGWIDGAGQQIIPRHPTAGHPVPCPWHVARSRAVAADPTRTRQRLHTPKLLTSQGGTPGPAMDVGCTGDSRTSIPHSRT